MKPKVNSVLHSPDGRTISIRPAVIADADGIMALARHVTEHFDIYHVDTLDEFRSDIAYWEKLIIRHEDRPNDLLLVATAGDDIVGLCDFSVPRQQRLHHWGSFAINVRTDHQGLGIGRHLLISLLHWAEEHPAIEIVTLKVHADNLRAIHLYESLGFIRTGIIPNAIKYSDTLYRDAAEMYLPVKKSTSDT